MSYLFTDADVTTDDEWTDATNIVALYSALWFNIPSSNYSQFR